MLNELATLQHLRVLDLYGTAITDAGLKGIRQFRQLRSLDLGDTLAGRYRQNALRFAPQSTLRTFGEG